VKYSRLPSSKRSEASVFQIVAKPEASKGLRGMAIDRERANRRNELRRAGLHLRSSPPVFTSPFLARSTRDSCTCSMLFGSNRERSKAHFRVLWASASLQARPFADCAAAPATIPTTPTPRSSRRLITHFSPPSGRTFRFERWNVQSDAYTRPPPPPPAE